MRLVVLGSTGMAGHVVATYLEERGHEVFRVSRSERSTQKSIALDITRFDALDAFLDRVQPDAVINCIGLLQKASEERPDLAVLINAYLPHRLEKRYAGCRTRVIHLSTDCVFSGKRGNYREADVPDGPIMYDRSKALGELRNDKDLTFRMSIIGPDSHPRGTGLFNWFMAQTGEISGWSGAIWNGVTTIELARAIDAALQTDLSGLYHLVPNRTIDKYSLLTLFRETFGRTALSVKRTQGLAADKSLCNTRTDFDFAVRDYPRQIQDMKQWIDAHRELYPHYFP